MTTFAPGPFVKPNCQHMNKLYIPALAGLMLAQLAHGQQLPASALRPSLGLPKTHSAQDLVNAPHYTPAFSAQSADRVEFWSEDFSGGAIPTGWTNTDDLTPSGTPEVTFVWANNPNDVSVAALGYTPSAIFNASTAANGYLWCNSDRGLTVAPGFDHGTHLTTAAIDCSLQPSVQLTFESLIGVFDYDASTAVKVRVSTNMTDWTDFVPFPCLVTGAAAPPCVRWSANPQGCVVNITSVAAGQATVYIQFEWIGGWEYFWAIDDLKLTTVPDYDRTLDFSVLSHTGYGDEYGCIPRPQLKSSFVLGGQVRNTGLNPQNNTVLNTNVMAPGGSLSFSASTSMGTIAGQDTAYVEEAITLPSGLAEGIYTATTWVTSDENANEVETANDTVVRTFKLDDMNYALDGIGVHLGTPVLSQVGTASFLTSEDGVLAFTYYPIDEQVTVYGIKFLLSANSGDSGTVRLSIHDSTLVVGDGTVVGDEDVFSPLVQGSDYTISQTDLDNGFVDFVFTTPYVMAPGAYYAGLEMNSVAGLYDMAVLDDATVPQPQWASCINLQTVTPAGTYNNGNALAIRLLLDPSIGMEDREELTGVNMFPNPTNGLVNLNFAVQGAYTVDLINALGEMVSTRRLNGNSTIDLSDLATGVYSVRISNKEKTTVQRISLN